MNTPADEIDSSLEELRIAALVRQAPLEFARVVYGLNDRANGRAGTTTLYVTHNLAEAVRLGQQIVVLSRRPGRVREVFRIDRPLTGRSADDPDLKRLEHLLWRIIRDDAMVAERERIDAT